MKVISNVLKVPVCVYTSIFFCMMFTGTRAQVLTPPVYDTTYFRSYPDDIIGRVFLSQKYLNLEVAHGGDAPRLRYKSNSSLNLGIGATYKNLTLNLAYGFGFLNTDEEKGKTKKLDLQSRIYSRKWAIDFYGQFYKEYYAYPKGLGRNGDNNYYIRQDLKVNLVGITAYKILNFTRFTLHPAFVQDELQLKSAGSLLAGGQVYYGGIRGDSAIVPFPLAMYYDRRSISKVRIFEIGPGIGYVYTQVLPYHLYLTGSVTFNVNAGFVQEVAGSERSNRITANANLLYRIGGGYNNGNWNVNAFWVNTRLVGKGENAGNSYIMNTGNYRLIFSKRIQPGTSLKKMLRPLDRLLQ